jgi:hypothetical protein
MRIAFYLCRFVVASILLTPLSIFSGRPLFAANADQYVLVLPGPTCSIKIENVDVKTFRMLLPVDQVKRVVNSTTIISVHVCECFLLGGDLQKCALDAITKAARPVQLPTQDAALLAGRIFVFIESTDEFSKVYLSLSSAYPRQASNVAWRILRAATPSSAAGPGAPPSALPPQSPPPQSPPPAITPGASAGDEQQPERKRACEVESNVCVNPKTDETSAEFELKCEGLPPIVFSTDGKAGLKIGPLEISLSVGGGDKH